jgi:hypothetical protein
MCEDARTYKPQIYKHIYYVFVSVLTRTVSLTADGESRVSVHENDRGDIGTPKRGGLPVCAQPESVILNTLIFVDTVIFKKIFFYPIYAEA